jgi:pyruvate/2-oxoglutarate/acetoin dehydrogenase E1 component
MGRPDHVRQTERGEAVTMLEAIREALWEELERDPDVFIMGEDIGAYGGAFKVTDGFLDRFGAERVVDTPISEAGFTGAGGGRG